MNLIPTEALMPNSKINYNGISNGQCLRGLQEAVILCRRLAHVQEHRNLDVFSF